MVRTRIPARITTGGISENGIQTLLNGQLDDISDSSGDNTSETGTSLQGSSSEEDLFSEDEVVSTSAKNIASTSTSPIQGKKRRLTEDVSTSETCEILKSNEYVEDKFFHFAMNMAAKLRKLPEEKSAQLQLKIQTLLDKLESS